MLLCSSVWEPRRRASVLLTPPKPLAMVCESVTLSPTSRPLRTSQYFFNTNILLERERRQKTWMFPQQAFIGKLSSLTGSVCWLNISWRCIQTSKLTSKVNWSSWRWGRVKKHTNQTKQVTIFFFFVSCPHPTCGYEEDKGMLVKWYSDWFCIDFIDCINDCFSSESHFEATRKCSLGCSASAGQQGSPQATV